MSSRLPTGFKHKVSKIYDFFTFVVVFVLLLGALWMSLPQWLAPIGSFAGALVFFLIYDSVRSDSSRNAEVLQIDRPGAEKLGWWLCTCNLGWPVIYFFLAHKVYKPVIYSGPKTITFMREEAALIGLWLIPVFTIALFLLLMWAWWKKVRQKQQIAVALALVLISYPIGAMMLGITLFVTEGRQWDIRQKIRGNDSRTYYLLHAPPPFNGPGTNVIARQMKHSPISVTVQILTPKYGSGDLTTILSEGSEDKDAKVRALCKMLLQSKKGWGEEKY